METRTPHDATIALASEHTVYHNYKVSEALANMPSETQALYTLYEQMLERGGMRFLVSPSSPDCLDALQLRCPNFSQVIERLKGDILLANKGGESMSFSPILLLGNPGVGKTHFASSLARLLGTEFQFVSMSTATAGWLLSGAHPSWKSAQHGKVAEVLIKGDYANPVVLIDEIDKAGDSKNYDPLGALYTLLERDTAKGFTDEFVNIPIDASRILWIATANDGAPIPKPILNRMDVYEIPNLTREETMDVARTIYEEILSEHHWGFVEDIADDVLQKMDSMQPRDIRKVLMTAFRIAIASNRDHLISGDVKKVIEKQSIGFR